MRKKGSSTPVKLIMILARNPTIKTKELVLMGYNPYTIRRYRKKVQEAEKELMGLR